MAKIAICFNGCIRPNLETFKDNVSMLTECFHGHEIETFLFTWKYADSINAVGVIDHIIMMDEQKDEHLRRHFSSVVYSGGWAGEKVVHHAKSFIRNLSSFRYVESLNAGFEYICWARPDISFKINLEDGWLTEDMYAIPNNGCVDGNDQFGIGKIDVMIKAWDFGNLGRLSEAMRATPYPEHAMMKIQEENNVKRLNLVATHYVVNRVYEPDWSSRGK